MTAHDSQPIPVQAETAQSERGAARNSSSGDQVIPRVIHQIWIGSPVPTDVQAFVQTWRDQHPDWRHQLWTDDNIDEFAELIQSSLFASATSYAMKADMLRLVILLRYGGLYVDADFECHRPIDSLVEGAARVFLSQFTEIANGLCAAQPGDPHLARIYDNIASLDVEAVSSGNFGILELTGPVAWSRSLAESGAVFEPGTRVLAPDLFLVPPTRNSVTLEHAQGRRFATHHALASWRRDTLWQRARKLRVRTRLRRFLDLSAP